MKIGKDSTFQDLIDLIKTKIPDPSNANPSMDGTVSPGSSVKYAREDHTHPSDTSKFDNSGGTITGSATIQGNLEAKEVKATDFTEVLEIDYTPNKSNIVQVNVSVQSNTYNAGYRLDTGSGSGESGTLSNTYSAFRVVVTQNNEVLYNEVHKTENKLYSYDIPKGSVNVKVYCMIGSVIDSQGNLLASKAEYTDPRFLNANNLHNEDPTSDSTVYLRRQTTGGMCAINKIVGGSVVKNQQITNPDSFTANLGTKSYDSATGVLTLTPARYNSDALGIYKTNTATADHKFLLISDIYPTNNVKIRVGIGSNYKDVNTTGGQWNKVAVVHTVPSSGSILFYARVSTAGWESGTLQYKNIMLIDLTQMFSNNPAIADYIYSLEQATAGSGIAKLAEWGFDFSVYHAYDAGSLQSVKLAGKKALDSDNNEIGFTPMSPTDLRGIYSLDASNNLVSDGDEYYPDGGESVGYDICDLGAQNWTQSSVVSGLFLTSNVTNYKISNDIKGICNKYNFSGLVNTVNNAAAKGDGTITVFYNSSSTYVNTRYIFVYDTSKSSMTDNEFKAAMNGVYLVYQKNAKTTAQLSPYQSLESIASNGTEEYIDYGVQQSQRDLAIPPYSFAEYTEGNAENVIASGDVIDGYNNVLREKENHRDLISLLGDDESGRTTASRAYNVNEFFYKDGAVYKVTASIASGAAFTVGTNCTQTTIFAVLTDLLNA